MLELISSSLLFVYRGIVGNRRRNHAPNLRRSAAPQLPLARCRTAAAAHCRVVFEAPTPGLTLTPRCAVIGTQEASAGRGRALNKDAAAWPHRLLAARCYMTRTTTSSWIVSAPALLPFRQTQWSPRARVNWMSTHQLQCMMAHQLKEMSNMMIQIAHDEV